MICWPRKYIIIYYYLLNQFFAFGGEPRNILQGGRLPIAVRAKLGGIHIIKNNYSFGLCFGFFNNMHPVFPQS